MYFPLKVSIPEPCHKDWNQMTPVEFNRRHCRACDCVLTDFSTMTDVQIGSHLRRYEGKLCGRFRADQLNREVAVGGPARFNGLRAAAAAAGLLLALPAAGQVNQPSVREQLEQAAIRPGHLVSPRRGPEAAPPAVDSVTISGTVVDDSGEALVFASLYVEALKTGTQADFNGYYELTVPRTEGLVLEVRYVGYADRAIEIQEGNSSATEVNVRMEAGALARGMVYAGMIVSHRSLAHRIFVAPVDRYVVWPVRQLSRNIREWRAERRATRPAPTATSAAKNVVQREN